MNREQQAELAAQMVDLAHMYPGQAVSIVFDGEDLLVGVLSASDFEPDDWMRGPVAIEDVEIIVPAAL